MNETLNPIRYDDLIKALKSYQEPVMRDAFDQEYVYENPAICEEAVTAIQTLLLENENLRRQIPTC